MSMSAANVARKEPSSSARRMVGRGRSGAIVPQLVGRSSAMIRVMRLAGQVAPTNSTVLITGETGVGKEVVARNIHHLSHLRDDIFLPVNCGAIPETLIESQLFGHAKGAFTGADSANEGLFFRARGGTIFLDEIGELPPRLQVKLLRTIEDKEILPLGTVNPIEVEVRIIAATNRDLRAEVDAGKFREDLFYRINVISIEIPPLRERREDIPTLVEHLVQRHNVRLGRNYRGADNETMNILLALSLKGNVRELSHMLEYSMVVGDGEWIRARDLPLGLAPEDGTPTDAGDNLATAMRRFAKVHIENVLHRSQGDRRMAAHCLGIDLSTLYRKIHELGIKSPS
jgi:transcriptional regulator with PAS, ATPase and Fis domain